MTQDTQQIKNLVHSMFCNYIGNSEPAVSRKNNEEGINIFVGGLKNARIQLEGIAKEVVDPYINTIGTFSMNILDDDGKMMNLGLDSDEEGNHETVLRTGGSWWCSALVETKKENAADLAATLRDNGLVALCAQEALDYANENDEEAAEVLEAIGNFAQNSNHAAAKIFGDRRVTKRYNLNKMLILFEASGSPGQEDTVWTNISRDDVANRQKNALDHDNELSQEQE